MTDLADDELEVEMEAEAPVYLHDGDFHVLDPEYLDPEAKAVGVLAILHSIERGQWVLIGRGGDGEPYTQEWQAIGEQAKVKSGKLRPVQ